MKKIRTNLKQSTKNPLTTTGKSNKSRSFPRIFFTPCQKAPFYPLKTQQCLALLEDLYENQYYTPITLCKIASNMGFINSRDPAHCFALELTLYKALLLGLPTYLKTHSEVFLLDLYPSVEMTGEDWRFFLLYWLERSKQGGVSNPVILN